jgi:Flp pilus assembly pilin Flp
MRHLTRALWTNDQGQNIVEYAMLVAGIVLAIAGSVLLVWVTLLREQ